LLLQAEAKRLKCKLEGLDADGNRIGQDDACASSSSSASQRPQEGEAALETSSPSVKPVEARRGLLSRMTGYVDDADLQDQTISPFSTLFAEVETFLAKKPELGDEDLKKYDNINDLGDGILKELYFKYNTRLPTSALSKRLFSTGGNIFTKSRTRLGKFLGVLLFLKVNWDVIL
jgi:hypothetical protein